MKNLDVFMIFLTVRLVSVYFVQTFYVPDEYWQTLEVAHNLVYEYGYLTWEWSKGIRSYIPPLVVSGLYKFLNLLGLDSAELLGMVPIFSDIHTKIYAPRVLQAFLSSYSDLCFYKWSGTKKWAVFAMASSWFWFYTGSRTLINTLECSLTTIALSKFPWPGKGIEESSTFIWITALLFTIRPTSAIVWLPLCLYHLKITKESFLNITFTKYFPIGFIILSLSTLIDSLCHGSLLIPPYGFLKFNLLENLSSFYGEQPWHWYLSSGLPGILGIQVLPFLLATVVVLKNRKVHPNELVMLGTIVFAVAVYSYLPHKEFRFLLPLLPLVFYISSRFLSAWSRKANKFSIWLVAVVIFIGNLGPAWYLGMVHQRGTLDVMTPLREVSKQNLPDTSLLFLMPCHSTPLYSHLHVNVTARFLTCLPNFSNIENYVDEADAFYKSPIDWLRQNYPPNGTLPSHIISYDVLVPSISNILSRYKLTHEIFHTNIPISSRIGRYVVIHKLIDF
ncbi:GPI mannosyltransferase 3 isoform X2 [Diabrotica virgifera virgifera]|uniref:Mannosyltransferase n=1 Tax=Diabrotica virgifera virgifera TaxID=50390 RepID=A0ABM5JJF2_DIAVI|nr:GPI mannosyltransferase 3 isoform X2 [Diabrotica virgifera virgifera]